MLQLTGKIFKKLRRKGLVYWMKRFRRSLFFVLVVSLFIFTIGYGDSSVKEPVQKPIVLQGAMDVETEFMMEALEDSEEFTLGGYDFARGTLEGYPVIVSKTQVGMVNAATSTTLAIEELDPLVIINQGTMGGHDKELHRGDIVLGNETANINSFKSEWKDIGEGMDPANWEWRTSEINLSGDSFEDVSVLNIDSDYLAIAESVKDTYTKGEVVKGLIGSGDVWNKELDRINLIQEEFNTSGEEMETFAVAQVCKQLGDVPLLSVRILSNAELHKEDFEPETAVDCQEYVLDIARKIIEKQE